MHIVSFPLLPQCRPLRSLSFEPVAKASFLIGNRSLAAKTEISSKVCRYASYNHDPEGETRDDARAQRALTIQTRLAGLFAKPYAIIGVHGFEQQALRLAIATNFRVIDWEHALFVPNPGICVRRALPVHHMSMQILKRR